MILTVDELLKGKACLIKDKEYRSAEAYVTPFLDRMSKYTSDFRVQAKLPDCLSIDQINNKDIWYSRVYIQAVMPSEYCFENHDEAIGMIYALDTRKPVVKLFRTGINKACLNLCVFSPSFINVQELEPEKSINYKPIVNLMEQTSDIKMWLQKITDMEVPYDEQLINENLGLWVRNALNKSYDNGYGKVKVAASSIIDAYKDVYENKKSPYYVKPGEITNMFNIYNSLTDIITNDGNKEDKHASKDIVTKPEKILLLKDIFDI